MTANQLAQNLERFPGHWTVTDAQGSELFFVANAGGFKPYRVALHFQPSTHTKHMPPGDASQAPTGPDHRPAPRASGNARVAGWGVPMPIRIALASLFLVALCCAIALATR
jgi:hypothetical protein